MSTTDDAVEERSRRARPRVEVLELRGEPAPLSDLLRDLARHADLLPLLARQHFLARFRAARLGLAWNVIQPFVRGAVLAVVFTRFIPIETEVPYPAFVLAGTAIWAFVSEAISAGTTGITGSADLTGKVYFPRLLLPAMPAAAAIPSFAISMAVVIGLTVAYGVDVSPTLLLLPLTMALAFVLVAAAATNLSLLHVYFRDVGPLVTTIVGVAFYATPIIYPLERAGDLAWLLEINPFTGVVTSIRWSLFGGAEGVGSAVWWTVGWTLVLAVTGVAAFRRHERVCADRL